MKSRRGVCYCGTKVPAPLNAPSGGSVLVRLKAAVNRAWLQRAKPPHFGLQYYTRLDKSGMLMLYYHRLCRIELVISMMQIDQGTLKTRDWKTRDQICRGGKGPTSVCGTRND